jgi:RAB6A-GEF complex partner protein 1
MQILAERLEFYWIHLSGSGVGSLENSLWGYDGSGMRVWLDALTIESARLDEKADAYEGIKESVNVPLSFYPLCESLMNNSYKLPLGFGSHY